MCVHYQIWRCVRRSGVYKLVMPNFMKTILDSYIKNWYIPILISIILGIIGTNTIMIHSEIIYYLSLGLPFFSLIASGLIGIKRLFNKDVKLGILQIGLTGLIGLLGLLIISMQLMFYPYDFYATNLLIPKNIKLNIPIGGEQKELLLANSNIDNFDISGINTMGERET